MKALAAIMAISLVWVVVPGRSPWERASISRPLREMIHVSAALVPPFAHEDSALADPREWTDAKEFAGRHCELSIVSTDYDVVITHKSLSTVRPGYGLHLAYVCRSPNGQELSLGPSYSWDRDGRLWRRTWYEPDTVMFLSTSYSTYPSGRLLEQASARRRQNIWNADSLIVFTEDFDRKGRLVGLAYEIHHGAQKDQFWWEGRPVSEAQWRKFRGELLRTAFAQRGSVTW
jgi:hypothetical protein